MEGDDALLGFGAKGEVTLVKRRHDNKRFAKKTTKMQLRFFEPKVDAFLNYDDAFYQLGDILEEGAGANQTLNEIKMIQILQDVKGVCRLVGFAWV